MRTHLPPHLGLLEDVHGLHQGRDLETLLLGSREEEEEEEEDKEEEEEDKDKEEDKEEDAIRSCQLNALTTTNWILIKTITTIKKHAVVYKCLLTRSLQIIPIRFSYDSFSKTGSKSCSPCPTLLMDSVGRSFSCCVVASQAFSSQKNRIVRPLVRK